ncbi:MAG: hypothetical protein DRP10_03255 [Candidatus Aenigmatarchaeota archaeon]|nr:MAG: hypothetical protein DRP10_03255 [Candidatus Aenigmarchaeota archaeon]
MVEFETLKSEEMKFGNNNFIEITRKLAKGDNGENEFLQIARGFFAPDGSKRYKKSIAIPADNEELKEFISEKIKEL